MTTYRKSMREALNEVYLEENNMNLLKKAAGGAMQTLKMKDGKVKMDSFTASAIMQVYKAINPKNKKTMENVVNTGTITALQKLQALAMRAIKSGDEVEHDGEELDEDGHTDVASAVRKCMTITEDAQDINSKLQTMSAEDSLPSWWTNKLAVASNDMNKMRDYIVNPVQEEVELDEAKYDLYHKDFSSAMQHAYAMAKKLHGITIDPKEIDDKVATGPKKPSKGKTNKYRLKGKGGNLQIQVYNKGGSKPFELNMYKEEVEINEDGHQDVASAIRQCKTITEDAMQILQKLQTMSPEDALPTWWTNKLAVASNSMNKMRDYLLVPSVKEALDKEDEPKVKKIIGKLKKASDAHAGQAKDLEKAMNEDGHTDVASAIRQCKTMIEDAMQITSKLQTMNPEESLPSWWTNKLAVSSNSMNKLRDYFLVPTTEEVELDEAFKPDQVKAAVAIARDSRFSMKQMVDKKTAIEKIAKGLSKDPAVKKVLDKMYEEFDLNEKAGDIPDLKNLVGELVKASGMHLAQSKRVQAHVDMMTKANAKGPEGAGGLADLKKIVGELQKASEAHKRQSKSIDTHVKFMEKMESIEDEMDESKITAYEEK